MSKSISAIITFIIAINIMFAADLSAAHDAYAQNTTTTPPRITTNSTSIKIPSIAGLNATTIINAINTKIKLIYDGDNGEEPDNSATTMTTVTTATKVAHEQIK
jgi:hypothetical protein